ncbi:acyl-ACP--UDP-N-acetylglucosamine O-acyltransferase [Rhodobacterales bacterium HKCCE2091]|nr:acyl-ACP--UDP-N-acetylglucosamine O-acyltransferase [Rhodobacterales bacterium HKCCE2091]
MAVDPAARVHPSAVIEDGAEIGPDCEIGAFSVIGARVRLGRGVVVKSHAIVTGLTEVGDETQIFPFSNIGDIPQDLKYAGEETRLVIGARNRIREGVTMNTGTAGGGGVTRVGDDCLFMLGTHVGHDARIGNGVILANHAAVAGHCVLEDRVIVGGLSGIHQWVRIGRGAIIGAVTMVTHDVIPYGLVQGPRGVLDGLNLVGLKRAGVAKEDITALRAAYQALAQGEGAFQERARRLQAEDPASPYVRDVVDFVLGASDRSFLTPG